MKRLTSKIKPISGFGHVLHLGLSILLPLLIYILVRIDLIGLAIALIFLAKWRMFAVKPRHWVANIRANAIDLIVGLSVLIFMTHTDSQTAQLVWALLYGVWLVILKPKNSELPVVAQALIGQFAGLTALFLNFGDSPLFVLVLGAWAVCYSAARHFFTILDEPLSRFLSHIWGYFAAGLTWILGHWLLYYGFVAQPVLLLSIIGFGLASLYYLDKTDKLSRLIRRQIIFTLLAVILVVLVFSDWGDKAI